MIFTCKPTFNPLLVFLQQGFLSLMAVGIFIYVYTQPSMQFTFNGEPMRPHLFMIAMLFVVVHLVVFAGRWVFYSQITYNFYDNHVECIQGIFSSASKIIRYSDIRELNLNKNLLQRLFGMGSIIIVDNSYIGYASVNVWLYRGTNVLVNGGIWLRDIENVDDAYEKITILMNAGKSKSAFNANPGSDSSRFP